MDTALKPTAVRVAVIPAAGLGRRLLPVSRSVPKALLPVIDEPVIDRAIEDVARAGIQEVIVIVSPGMDALVRHLEPSPDLAAELRREGRDADARRVEQLWDRVRVTVVIQERPAGNGDAVLQARAAVAGRPFLLVWPDDVVLSEVPVPTQLLAAREKNRGGSVAAVMRVSVARAKASGVIVGEQLREDSWRIREVIEKPEVPPSDLALIYGYVLEPAIFGILEQLEPGLNGEIWLTQAIDSLAKSGVANAQVVAGELFDVGSRQGYVRAIIAAAMRREDLRDELIPWLTDRIADEPASPKAS